MNGPKMIYGNFDNRHTEQKYIHARNQTLHFLRRVSASARGRRLPLYAGGGMHLRLPIQGQSIVYTYIRKNGCSAFKKWLRDTGSYETGKRETSEMAKRYSVSFGWEVSQSDFLLVLRDPAARLASLFRNKLIQRSYAGDILENIKHLSRKSPDNLTFRTFVGEYIGPNIALEALSGNRIDAHARPQYLHLWPVLYNKVAMLADLPRGADDLFPSSISQTYFCRQRNSSSTTLVDGDASDVSVRDLRENFLSTGALPSDTALFDDVLRRSVRSIYAADYDLLRSSFGHEYT